MSGADQIENYMSYSSDECMTTFTMGQALRMRESLKTYRATSVQFWSRGAAGVPFTYSPSVAPPDIPPPKPFDQVIADAPTLSCGDVVVVADLRVTGNDNIGSLSPELIYKISMNTEKFVKIKTCGSEYDTTLTMFTDQSVASQSFSKHLFNDDACDLQSKISDTLDVGVYYVVVEGYSQKDAGQTRIEMLCTKSTTTAPSPPPLTLEQELAIAPTLTCGGSLQGTTVGGPRLYGAQAPEAYFSIQLAMTTYVIVDSCGSSFDTTLRLINALDGEELQWNDDSLNWAGCTTGQGVQSFIRVTLSSGNYYVVLDGFGNKQGPYIVSMACKTDPNATVTPPWQPLITTLPTTTHSWGGSGSGLGFINATEEAPDVACGGDVKGTILPDSDSYLGVDGGENYYRLVLNQPTIVMVHTCNSTIADSGFDSVIRVYNGEGFSPTSAEYASNDDARGECQANGFSNVLISTSFLQLSLEAGVW
jgi:hypothetical protein